MLIEIGELQKSLWCQVRNALALYQWLQKRTRQQHHSVNDASNNVAASALFNLENEMKQGLSFQLKGSKEAIALLVATIHRKNYIIPNQAFINTATRTIKLKLNIQELVALEQELSITAEAIKSRDYLLTVLQWRNQRVSFKKSTG